MSKKLGQEPAFAQSLTTCDGAIYSSLEKAEFESGMSKRFYAACAAMQGLCVGKKTSDLKKGECVDIAEMSFVIADELLKHESNE